MATPFRVSEAASLALHAAAIIAGHKGRPVSASQIAGTLGASRAHLSKVLAQLSKAGVVHGATGPGGGFTLRVPARDLTLRAIYEAIEGPLESAGCLFDLPICEPATCPLSKLLCDVNKRILSGLERTTLDQFRVPRRKTAGAD